MPPCNCFFSTTRQRVMLAWIEITRWRVVLVLVHEEIVLVLGHDLALTTQGGFPVDIGWIDRSRFIL